MNILYNIIVFIFIPSVKKAERLHKDVGINQPLRW